MAEIDTAPELKTSTENLSNHVTDYVETYIKLSALKATQKVTEVATISFTAGLILFFGLIVMLFLGFGLASWFSESMSEKTGYFIVTLIYSFVAVIVLLCRKRLIFPFIRNQIVSKIYETAD